MYWTNEIKLKLNGQMSLDNLKINQRSYQNLLNSGSEYRNNPETFTRGLSTLFAGLMMFWLF